MSSVDSYQHNYDTESAWTQTQDSNWAKMQDTLDTFSSPTAQILFIVTTMYNFAANTIEGRMQWDNYDQNVASSLLNPDLDVIENSLSYITHDEGDPASYDSAASDAINAANAISWEVYTDPNIASPTLQADVTSSFSDLFGFQPDGTTTQTIHLDEDDPDHAQDQVVTVPQYNNTKANQDAIVNYWQGNEIPDENGEITGKSPEIGTPMYQAYLAEQQQWENDLSKLSTDFNDIPKQAQAAIQNLGNVLQELLGTWQQTDKQIISGENTQIQAEVRG